MLAPMGGAAAPLAAPPPTQSPPVRINIAESDGHIRLQGGASIRTQTPTGTNLLNFALDAGYRFFDSLDALELGVRGVFLNLPGGVRGLSFFAMGTYSFSPSNSGFFADLGLGYSFRISGSTLRGIAVTPNVGYHLPLTDSITASAEVGLHLTFGTSPIDMIFNAMAGIQYWF